MALCASNNHFYIQFSPNSLDVVQSSSISSQCSVVSSSQHSHHYHHHDERRGSCSSSSKSVLRSLLPDSFQPTPYSVVCGRGRMVTQSIGNRRLQVIAQLFIPRYSKCTKKEEKSEIVSEILEMVRNACTDDRYAFVRYAEGRWWEVETINAREKIGTVLRDCLSSKYKSSTKSKLARRKERKERTSASTSTSTTANNNTSTSSLLEPSDDFSVLSEEESSELLFCTN